MTSFGGKKHGGWSYGRSDRAVYYGPSFYKKINKTLKFIHERLQNVFIDHLDFRRCIKNWDSPETFFFMDPPYRNTEQANEIGMSDKDYCDLADICRKIKGKFLLTLNDDEWFLDLFSSFIIEVKQTPLASLGITRTVKRKKRGYYNHLLIRNYRLENEKT